MNQNKPYQIFERPDSPTFLSSGTTYAILGVFVSTLTVTMLGPKPSISTEGLSNGVQGLSEPRDLLVVICWWIIAALLVVASAISVLKGFPVRPTTKSSGGWMVLPAVAVVILYVSFFFPLDTSETGNIAIPNLVHIVGGAGILAAIGLLLCFHERFASSVMAFVALIACFVLGAYLIPSLWQWPGSVRDSGHFNFSSNELAAVAVGRFPLSDFVPQYSTLLGFPVAPLLKWFPNNSVQIVLAYLIILQLMILVAPAWVIARKVHVAMFFPTLFFCSILSVFVYFPEPQISSNAYFMGFPIRMFFPIMLLVYFVSTSNFHTNRARSNLLCIGGGVLGGVTALNNLEFGLPALIAMAIVFALTRPRVGLGIKAVATILISAIFVFITYSLIGLGIGKSVDWSNWTLFVRLFGGSGYMKVPMAWSGLHVAYVSTALLGLAAYALLMFSTSGKHTAITLFLGFSSLWMLLTFPYFAGRSFASTLIVGHSLQLGLVLSGLASLFYLERRYVFDSVRAGNRQCLTFLVLTAIPFLYVFSLAFSIPDLSRSISSLAGRQTTYERLSVLSTSVSRNLPENLDVAQILELSNMIELQSGVRSALIFSHPDYLFLSDEFLLMQCNYLANRREDLLFEMNDAVRTVLNSKSCNRILKPSGLVDSDVLSSLLFRNVD